MTGAAPDALDPLAAGRAADERHAWDEAYELLAGSHAPADLELRADAAQWCGRVAEMVALAEQAADAYSAAGDLSGAARVALRLAWLHWERGHDAAAAGCHAHAARLLDGVPAPSPEHARLAWLAGFATMSAGDVDRGMVATREALEIARRVGDRDTEALALLLQGKALVGSGRVEEGFGLLDEANAAATGGALGLDAAGVVYCGTISTCRNVGDWRRAAEWTDVSLRWCGRQRVNGFPGLCRFHRAEVLRMRGELAAAEQDAEAAIAELAATRPRYAGWGFTELGEIRRRRGDRAGAHAGFARALELGTDPQPGLALLLLDEGDPAGAHRMLERSLRETDVMAREARARLLPAAVTTALASGDPDRAGAHLAELDRLADGYGTPSTRAASLGAHGEVALHQGDAAGAVEHLRASWRTWCATEAPYEAAAVRVQLADAHRLLGDDAAASLELEAAIQAFERLCAADAAGAARSALGRTWSRPPR